MVKINYLRALFPVEIHKLEKEIKTKEGMQTLCLDVIDKLCTSAGEREV